MNFIEAISKRFHKYSSVSFKAMMFIRIISMILLVEAKLEWNFHSTKKRNNMNTDQSFKRLKITIFETFSQKWQARQASKQTRTKSPHIEWTNCEDFIKIDPILEFKIRFRGSRNFKNRIGNRLLSFYLKIHFDQKKIFRWCKQ